MCDRCRTVAERPLEVLVAQLRASCEAAARLQGGTAHYHEQCAIFRDFARAEGFLLDHNQSPDELSSTPDEEGNEHQVWFRPQAATFLKATWPGFFGLLVVHRHDEEPSASPIDYLERWHLHNEVFGDSVVFHGAIDSPDGLRLLIEQPAIIGQPATVDEIDHFFTSSGWKSLRIDGNLAFFDPHRNLVISDTHVGNIITMPNGRFAPIDLRVQPLTPALTSIVENLCHA